MKEVLLNIGSIIEVENKDNEKERYMIIGRRVINPESMRAWDYIAVWYPTGLKRTFKSNKELLGDDFFYCNHPDIDKVIYDADLIEPATEDDEGEGDE